MVALILAVLCSTLSTVIAAPPTLVYPLQAQRPPVARAFKSAVSTSPRFPRRRRGVCATHLPILASLHTLSRTRQAREVSSSSLGPTRLYGADSSWGCQVDQDPVLLVLRRPAQGSVPS
jgi:hypothetical protein